MLLTPSPFIVSLRHQSNVSSISISIIILMRTTRIWITCNSFRMSVQNVGRLKLTRRSHLVELLDWKLSCWKNWRLKTSAKNTTVHITGLSKQVYKKELKYKWCALSTSGGNFLSRSDIINSWTIFQKNRVSFTAWISHRWGLLKVQRGFERLVCKESN